MIAIVCGLVCGLGLVLAASPWFTPAPVRTPWGPWRRLTEDVGRARVPGLTAVRLARGHRRDGVGSASGHVAAAGSVRPGR